MTLRLRGSTSGYAEINAPAVAGDNSLTLPTTTGTIRITNPSGVDGDYTVATGATIIGSTNTIRFDTGANPPVQMDSNGHVGIGTNNNTSAALDVHGDIRISRGGRGDGTGKIMFGSDSGDYLQLQDIGTGGNIFELVQDGSKKVVVRGTNGNVGMGTDVLSASSRLTLFEESGNGQTLEIKAKNSGGAGSQPGIKFTANNGDNIGGVYGDVNSDSLKIQTGGTDRVVVSSAGTSEFTSGSSDLCAKFTGNGIRVEHAAGSEIFFGTQTGTDGKIGTENNANLHLYANGYGNGITVNPSGNLSISDGNLVVASGHGIDFSATADGSGATSINELLDDYEEGYWTPTIASGGNPSSTLSVYRARYTKIGRQVNVTGEVLFDGGDNGNFRLQGLPYNLEETGTGSGHQSAGISAVGTVLFNNLNITSLTSLKVYLWSNIIYFYYTPGSDGGNWNEITGAQVGGNTGGGNLIFTATYLTAT